MASVVRLFVALLATQASMFVVVLHGKGQLSRGWAVPLLAIAAVTLFVELRSLYAAQPDDDLTGTPRS